MRLLSNRRPAWIGVLLLALAIPVQPGTAQSIEWDSLAEGLAATLWTPPSSCPDVPPLLAFEIDPFRFRFTVHYFRAEGLAMPPDIHEWRDRTGHALLFNAGLFRENFAYLGLLYGGGRSLGGKRHATWLGLFAAEPTTPDAVPARVLDLATESFDEQAPPYREAAQSLMLLDQTGTVRVRQSGKQAQQTIVAEQRDGRILLLKTTRAATLYDLANCLRASLPSVRRAMAMDGGSSSDVALAAPLRRTDRARAGGSGWMEFLDHESTGHIGLPSVIGISPREGQLVQPAKPQAR